MAVASIVILIVANLGLLVLLFVRDRRLEAARQQLRQEAGLAVVQLHAMGEQMAKLLASKLVECTGELAAKLSMISAVHDDHLAALRHEAQAQAAELLRASETMAAMRGELIDKGRLLVAAAEGEAQDITARVRAEVDKLVAFLAAP